MDAREFQNLQEGLLYLFGPLVGWWIALLVVGGAISIMNMTLLAWWKAMKRRR